MSKFRFDRRKVDTNKLLIVLGNNAVNYFKIDTFNKQAFDGDKWKELKKPTDRRKLVKTGRMRQSIRVLKRSSRYIQVGTDVPYAQYHNEGSKYIPKRQFIGKSRQLNRINEKTINRFVKDSMRKR